MNSKLNFRSVVFKRAYRIVKESKCGFRNALKQAWNRYREFKAQMIQELSARIKGFDFNYPYSDDGRVYHYWSQVQKDISCQLKQLPRSFILIISSQLTNPNKIYSFI